jgi:TonB family protein
LEPTNAEAHYVLGTVGLMQGLCADATEQANLALSTNSNFPSAYLLRSQSFICEIAKNTLKPLAFDGTVFKTSSDSSEVSKDLKLLNARKNAVVFQKAASDLETFLKLAPQTPDAAMWREQLETLRLYAQPAEKTESERNVFISAEVTTRARILKKPEPSYSESARNAQVEGTVVLRAILAADGQVKNILVLGRLPHGLTERAIEAARMIKFQPAVKDGRPVSVLVQIEYNFNLY